MEIVIILGSLIVAIILLLLLRRFIAYYRIKKIRDISQYPLEFQKKYYYFKERENQRTTTTLMIITILLSALISVSLLGMSNMADQVNMIQRKDYWTQIVAQSIFKEIKNTEKKASIKNYPNGELGFEKNKISDLPDQEIEQRKVTTKQLEETLSNKLSPYFGDGVISLSLDNPTKTLEITFTGEIKESANNVAVLSKNIPSFITEVEKIPNVTEVYIQIKESGKHKMIYQGTFVRNMETRKFELRNDTRKGKG